MGNTCKPMAVSFQCMTKFTTKKKKKELEAMVLFCGKDPETPTAPRVTGRQVCTETWHWSWVLKFLCKGERHLD